MTLEGIPVTLAPGAMEAVRAALSGRADLERYRLRLEAERLDLADGFDELIALEGLPFVPFPYQIRAARAALRRMRGRALLADEVGLGKTIEAGLIIRELRLRGLVRRVLVLAPPGLVGQWREEMAVKFGLDFVTHEDAAFRERGDDAWAAFPLVIASLATARHANNRAHVEAADYDLIVIDEAHHLKNRRSVTWKFANALTSRYLLLATATPVQNSLDELYNIVTLLQPGQLSTPAAFKRRFVVRGDPRAPANRGMLRELLADVMVRHTRAQVEVRLPPRRATTVRLDMGPGERAFYDAVTAFVREEAAGGASRFALQVVQREAGSCPDAAIPTLEKMARGDDALRELAGMGRSVRTWAKADALHDLLRSGAAAREKAIVFTHFRVTLDALAERLGWLGDDLVVYHGGLSAAAKEEAITRFEEEGRVLLSTEAAGEGRNLQFCRVMINFDLPWNPQRIEQRVGRIHRVGQTAPVEIFNLVARDTVEDYMLGILSDKLNLFELVIGEMDMILGQMADERDFDDLLFERWVRSRDAEEAASAIETLGEEMVEAREAYRRMQAYDDALFGEDFGAE